MDSYKETLKYLFSQLPMYQRSGAKAIKKGLENIRALLYSLGNPHKDLLAIHIAGTNGKGTVSHMLSAVYQAAGFKVGLYTSPHYKDFRERIKINGKPIAKKEVVRFVGQFKLIKGNLKPSFFELSVAMAFDAFDRHNVDLAIVETGLGGRLDSTNVLRPMLSVITNIGYDHTHMLGDTLEEIAGEKAGIIKKNIPVVVGEYQKAPAPVFKAKAHKTGSPISFASRRWQAVSGRESLNNQVYSIRNMRGKEVIAKLKLSAGGPFQKANLITALQAIKVLSGTHPEFNIKAKALRNGFKNIREFTGYQGRWQILNSAPCILCDSAHNKEGLKLVLNKLKSYKNQFAKFHFVLGFVNEKDIKEILSLFPTDGKFYFSRPKIPRGADADKVLDIAHSLNLNANKYVSVKNALTAAKRQASKRDLIFIGGSTFVVAEVL